VLIQAGTHCGSSDKDAASAPVLTSKCDVSQLHDAFGTAAVDALGAQVNQHDVVVCAACKWLV
jgi:hypothetical protein